MPVIVRKNDNCIALHFFSKLDNENDGKNRLMKRVHLFSNSYRCFWILWKTDEMSIHVGTGHEKFKNEILTANKTVVDPHDVNLDKISNVSISTTASNRGYWRFNNQGISDG